MAPTSTPRVGWPTISTPGSCSISRASTIFCWLPPEKLAVFSRGLAGRMSYFSIFSLASATDGVDVEERAVQILRLVVIAEDRILVLLEGEHQADMVAVLRHMGEAAVAQLAGIGDADDVDRLAVEHDPAGHGAADAGDRLDQLGLAVAGDAGDADDLAGAHVEGDVVDHGDAARILDRQVLHRKLDRAGMGLALLDAQQHAAADHQLGELLDGGLRGLARRHHRALAHDRHVVGDRHDLAQLVGDQHDRLALLLELLEDAEQVVGLGRRQHAGRLVEDQDLGAAIERLENFDALLQADRQLLDDGVGIDFQPVFALEPLQLGARLGDARLEQRLALGAEDDVLQHREILDQHEMLVDHADAERDGVVGRVDRHRLAADADLAAVGLVEAVEDRHQRRLAGAVLADDAVDRAALDFEVDVAVGMDRAKALVDADQLDCSFRHAEVPPLFFIVWSKR